MFITVITLAVLLAILIVKREKATILELGVELKAFYRHLFSKATVTEFRDDITHVAKVYVKAFKQLLRGTQLAVYWLTLPLTAVLVPLVCAVLVAVSAYFRKD